MTSKAQTLTKRTTGKRVTDPIPEFKNHQEEADFWDTHDLADYWGQFKPVNVRFAKNLSNSITVRFDAQDIDALRVEGEKKGVGPTTLIRMWVKERLASERRAATRTTRATRTETKKTAPKRRASTAAPRRRPTS